MQQSTWKYFSLDELKCKCGKCGSTGAEMDPKFMVEIEILRDLCNFPFVVTSAYRCPEHNAAVSSSGKNGVHTKGIAIDIAVSGQRTYHLLRLAFEMEKFTGIGINQKGTSRYIHLDTATQPEFPRPTVWSY